MIPSEPVEGLPFHPPRDGRTDETDEEWMRGKGATTEFWMKLRAYKEWMLWQFDNLHQIALGICPRNAHPMIYEAFAISVVDLIAVAVTL